MHQGSFQLFDSAYEDQSRNLSTDRLLESKVSSLPKSQSILIPLWGFTQASLQSNSFLKPSTTDQTPAIFAADDDEEDENFEEDFEDDENEEFDEDLDDDLDDDDYDIYEDDEYEIDDKEELEDYEDEDDLFDDEEDLDSDYGYYDDYEDEDYDDDDID